MSSTQFNNKRQSFKPELIHLNGDFARRIKKKMPISGKATGILYGIERPINKFIESLGNKELLTEKKEKYIIDEPSPEGYGDFFEERKKLLFNDFMKNENFIGQFIKKTQKNLIEKSKTRISFIFERSIDIYETMICLKETIANYCLVIKLYLMRNNYNRALELFLLMVQKNKNLFEYMFKKIREQFPKITNSNRIGKFFPLIIRKYLEILSCLVKLSDKFKKPQIHNMFIKYYIKTFFIVCKTVELRFNLISNGNFTISDIKNISKYLYANIYFDIGIFYFMKYHSFLFTIKLLEHVLDLYKNYISNDLLMPEGVLLLKTNYNLGLFLYADGQSHESIQYILEAKNILTLIKLNPLTRDNSKKRGNIYNIEPFENNAILSKSSYDNLMISNMKKEKNKSNKELKISRKKNGKKTNFILFGNQINTEK